MAACSRQILGTPREWAVRLTVGVTLGVFFGLIGPFGSYAQPLPLRMAFWITGFCLGVSLFSTAVRAARLMGPRLDLPPWFATGLAVALVCIPFSIVLDVLFNASSWRRGGWPVALEFYGDCLLISAPLTVGYTWLLARLRAAAPALPQATDSPNTVPAAAPVLDAAPPNPASPAGLLAALPPRLGRDLLALQMEDHYVRAHTLLGSDLLLMPLGQAVEALGDLDGLRVHRSWWVARAAVEGAAWDGRNLRLRLRGGLEAPVARAQVAPLRAAGWLDGRAASP